MAIAFRAAAHSQIAGGVVSKPAGTASGDVLVAISVGNASQSAPVGWTKDLEVNLSSIYAAIFHKVAGGSEPSSYTWTGGTVYEGGIAAFTGVDNTTPLSGTPTGLATGAASTVVPSITVAAGAMLVGGAFGYAFGSDGSGLAPGAGMTERWEENYTNTFFLNQADQVIAGAGATGTRTFTLSGTLGSGAAVLGLMLALKPAVVAAALAATSAGASSASTSRIRLPRALAAQSAGVSSASAARIRKAQPLAGAIAGDSSAAAAAIHLPRSLAAAAGGASSLSAARIRLPAPLAAQSVGDSVAAADRLRLPQSLAAASAGLSAATASRVRLNRALAGAVLGGSAASATRLHLDHRLIAIAIGNSTAFSDLTIDRVIARIGGILRTVFAQPVVVDRVQFDQPIAVLRNAIADPLAATRTVFSEPIAISVSTTPPVIAVVCAPGIAGVAVVRMKGELNA